MSFAQPVFLVGLALVPLALAVYVRHEHIRRLAVDAFAAPAVRASVAPSTPGWRRHVPLAIYTLALTVLLIALAKPQTTVAVPVERASIMLTTDFSGSMQATDVAPTRLAAARAAAERFLGQVPGSVRVGLVTFNQAARLVTSPTTDRDARALGALEPEAQRRHGDGRGARGLADRAGRGDRRRRRPRAGRDRPAVGRQVRPRAQAVGARAARQGAQDPDLHGRARHRVGHDHRHAAQRHDARHAGPARPRRDAAGRRRSPAGAPSPPTTSRSSAPSTSSSARASATARSRAR